MASWVSRLGKICVISPRFRYTNSHRRRLSSTAPVPERPATKSSKSGMQNVFWTSTARRQIRKVSSAAGRRSCSSAHADASRARSSYGTRQTSPTVLGSKCGGSGSSRITGQGLSPQGTVRSSVLGSVRLVGQSPFGDSPSFDELQARIRPIAAPRLRRGPAVGEDDIGREIVGAADQRRADPVGVDTNAAGLELANLLDGEPARHDDLDVLEPVVVERVADLAHQALVDAGRLEVAELVPERAVDERLRRVEPHAPEPWPESAGDLECSLHGVVLEVDEYGHVEILGRPLGELRGREHGVAAVGRDQRMGDRADAFAAPPRGLRIRGDPDWDAYHLAGDVGRIAVAGLDKVMVVAGRHED